MIKPKQNSRSGFTLVELLVVMGIIAILASIATPAYLNALSHARTAKCSGNLRTIGAAMITFAGDNNGNLPISGSTILHSGATGAAVDPTTKQWSWTEQLEPYLGSTANVGTSTTGNGSAIFQCPDWQNAADSNGKRLSSTANPSKSYSYFNGAHAAGAGQGSYGAVNLYKIKATSAHIIAGDIAFENFGPFSPPFDADPDDYGANNPAFGDGTKTILIHGGTVNLVFADGHVQNAKTYDNTSMTTHYAGIQPTLGYSDYP